MTEARIMAEGSLRWAQASGDCTGWITASAAPTALVGYVQAGLAVASAREVLTVYDRGYPKHHKITQHNAPEITFSYLQAVTANMPSISATASGNSVPLYHFELKHDVKEAAGSAEFWQFIGCALVSRPYAEQAEGNQFTETWRALRIVGPTNTGYLATGGQ
jgi:hypothetical protein